MSETGSDHALEQIVSELLAYEASAEFDLDDWYDVYWVEAQKRISTEVNEGNKIPHIIWHYLSDADIRSKDEQYAKVQIQAVKDALGL